jgi:hypothetical protein
MAQDFQALEREARAATQAAKDQAAGILEELSTQKKIVDSIITEVRSAAAEQGVGKQAIHFKNEADNHAALSSKWLERTVKAAIILIIYSIISLFIHRIDGIADGDYAMFQLAVSKILIFAVLAYGVILSARNFLSHKHNEIINRHRQNALATFAALAEATSDAASSDIVLSHAAACIFAPQETGYTKSDSVHTEGVPALQILPRIGAATGSSSQ